MKVIFLATSDSRQRHRFLIKPLEMTRHRSVLFENSSIWLYPLRLLLFAFRHRDAGVVILFAGGFKNAIGFLVARIIQACVVFRLGGDVETVGKSYLKGVIKEGKIATYFKFTVDQWLTRLLLSKADAFIIVNRSLQKTVDKYAKPKAPIWVISQFAEPHEYSRMYSSESTKNLLTIANFKFREKADGVIWMLHQLRHFVEIHKLKMTFRILGNGPFLGIVRKEAEQIDEKDFSLKVDIEGFKEEVSDDFKWAGIFIYNSQLDATPNVIIEAKSHGLPILINNYEPFRNLVIDGKSGYIYSNKNQFQIKLHKLMTKKKELRRIGSVSKEDYFERFSREAVASQIDSVLKELEIKLPIKK